MPLPDVLVVGAGIIGCGIAHELARRGARVTLVDSRGIGQGATRASAGVLAPFIESEEGGLLRDLGARSLELYDDFVARAAEDTGTRLHYARNGTLQVASDETGLEQLRAAATGHTAAGVGHQLLDRTGTRAAEPHLADDVLGGLIVPAHGYVAAGELTAALARAAIGRGSVLLEPQMVTRIEPAGRSITVSTTAGRLAAGHVVLAAGSWSSHVEIAAGGPLPTRPVRGQLLHLTWPGSPLTRVLWGERCYIVPWPDSSVLVGATVEEVGFDERTTVAGVRDLLEAACDLVPEAWRGWFKGARAGLRPGTPDDLPIIGRSAEVPGLVYATGHYRNGVLLAPLTARLVADLMLEERRDPALEALSPARFFSGRARLQP